MPDRLDEVLRQAQDLGLFGPGDIADQRRHAEAFCRLAAEGLPGDLRFLDLGAGGGLPGLVLATMLPTARGTLLDSQQRRTRFLTHAVDELGMDDRISVVTARAEDAARDPDHRERYDLVVARSFAPPPVTAECATGFLPAGARLAVSEPPQEPVARWKPEVLGDLALSPPELRRTDGTTVAVLHKQAPTPTRYPRKPGIPQKRPLW